MTNTKRYKKRMIEEVKDILEKYEVVYFSRGEDIQTPIPNRISVSLHFGLVEKQTETDSELIRAIDEIGKVEG